MFDAMNEYDYNMGLVDWRNDDAKIMLSVCTMINAINLPSEEHRKKK